MSVERAERTPAVTVLIGLIQVWHVQVSGRQEEFGRVCLQVKKKTTWFHLDLCLCICCGPAVQWCAIFTQSNHSESSADIFSVEIAVSWIHNTFMPAPIDFFSSSAVRMWLSHKEIGRDSWQGCWCILGTFEIVIIALSRSVSLEKSIIGGNLGENYRYRTVTEIFFRQGWPDARQGFSHKL